MTEEVNISGPLRSSSGELYWTVVGPEPHSPRTYVPLDLPFAKWRLRRAQRYVLRTARRLARREAAAKLMLQPESPMFETEMPYEEAVLRLELQPESQWKEQEADLEEEIMRDRLEVREAQAEEHSE